MPNPVRTYTIKEILRRTFLLIGAIADNQTPSAAMMMDGLNSLNDLLEQWSTDNLTVYGTTTEEFSLQAAKAQYSIGVGGDFDVDRPVHMNSAYCTFNGVSYPIQIISQSEYDRISYKALPNPIVGKLLYINSYELGQIFLHPVPSDTSVKLKLNFDRLLTVVTDINGSINFPPGYYRAMRYALAVDLWSEYPNTQTDIEGIRKIAVGTRADIMRSNSTDQVMSLLEVPGTFTGRDWDWREG